jgi:CDP-glucose 4,6-dehydratase
MLDTTWYKDKRVFITGYSGFKGSWLCSILLKLGAQVYGYALRPSTEPNLHDLLDLDRSVTATIADIRDYDTLSKATEEAHPDVVIHMAAQPLVRESYRNPRYTYEVNVMGTVNILECLRTAPSVRSFLNVTTDKVYLNDEKPHHRFREDEPLDGYDPYSNSKSCSELVTHSYLKSFFSGGDPACALSTARAGNVIGGGDFSADRIVSDCVHAAATKTQLVIRNPHATRPYQHVLEPLLAYLIIAQQQVMHPQLAGWYNVGPNESDQCSNIELVEHFGRYWGSDFSYQVRSDGGPHEAGFLELDNSKLKQAFDWQPCWSVQQAVAKTVEFTRAWLNGDDLKACMSEQIEEYLACLSDRADRSNATDAIKRADEVKRA